MNYTSLADIRNNYPPSFNAAAPVWAHKDQVEARIRELEAALQAAVPALRSYQYGNTATYLAKEIADRCSAALAGSTQDREGEPHG